MADSEKHASFTEEATQEAASIEVKVAQVVRVQVTEDEDRKVLRKIDFCVLPLMCLCYMLQLMDKSSLSYSTLLGLMKDVNLRGSEYSWCSSIFYFGYLAWSWPNSYLVVRFPMGKYLSVSVLIWSAILMCHGACNNFASLMAVRFFLGVAEAAVAPGFTLITGMFYTRKEQPLRQGIWFAGNAIANLFGGLVAYAIGHIDSSVVASWRLLFLILGGVTAAYSVLLFIFLPDSPSKAFFLKSEERTTALHRVLQNKTGIMDEGTFKKSQVLDALKDPQAWLLVLYTLSVNITNGGVTSFASLIIEGFGFSSLRSLLLQMTIGASQLVFLISTSFLATYFRGCRLALMCLNVIVSLIGMVMVYALDEHDRGGRLAGICLGAVFAANIPLSLSLISSNVAGFTKKATIAAMLFIAYSAGNIIGPQFFFPGQAPRYQPLVVEADPAAKLKLTVIFLKTGIRSSIATLAFGLVFLVALLLHYILENRRRNAARPATSQIDAADEVAEELSGQTDRQNPNFRYVV